MDLAFDAPSIDQPVRMETLRPHLGARLTVWTAGIGRHPYEDAHAIRRHGRQLRVVAIDGVTPTAQTPAHHGVDGAIWAARTARRALLAPGAEPLEAVARTISASLYDPSVPSRSRTAVTMGGVDICQQPDGSWTGVATRAGDCEVWVSHDGGWSSVFPGDMLNRATRMAYTRWRESHAGATVEALDHFEEELLRDPNRWNTTPLGRFATVAPETAVLPAGWNQVVVASDGARLDEARVAALPQWMASIRAWESANGLRGDDVTVVGVKLPPRPELLPAS